MSAINQNQNIPQELSKFDQLVKRHELTPQVETKV